MTPCKYCDEPIRLCRRIHGLRVAVDPQPAPDGTVLVKRGVGPLPTAYVLSYTEIRTVTAGHTQPILHRLHRCKINRAA